MSKLNIPELNSREELMSMPAKFNTLDIPARNGAYSSVQARIEKAVMIIQKTLREFDRPTRARIIGPVVEEMQDFLQKNPPCPICNQVNGHMPWCSMARHGNEKRIEE